MGISDLFSTFISTPGKVFNYVQENILKSPRQQKRPRDDSAGLERHEQPVARLKLSLPDPGDKADSRRGNLSGNTPQHLLDDRIVSGEVVSPPAHWLQKQQEARGLKRLPGALHYSSPAKRGKSNAAASPAQPLQLWSSIRNTRHGPQTGFRRAHTPVMPTTTPMLVRHDKTISTLISQAIREASTFITLSWRHCRARVGMTLVCIHHAPACTGSSKTFTVLIIGA